MEVQNIFYPRVVSGSYYKGVPPKLKDIVIEAARFSRNVDTSDWIPIDNSLLSLIEMAEKENLIHEGQRVLEMGSGSGSAAIMWADKGYNVIGIELNPRLVEISKKYVSKAQPFLKGKIEIYQGSYYPKEYIDLRQNGKSIATLLEEIQFRGMQQKTFHPVCGEDVYKKHSIELDKIEIFYGYFWTYHFPSVLEMFSRYTGYAAKLFTFGSALFNDEELDKHFNLRKALCCKYDEEGKVFAKIKKVTQQ